MFGRDEINGAMIAFGVPFTIVGQDATRAEVVVDGVSDESEIQSLIDAGKNVFLLDGDYDIQSTLLVDDNTVIAAGNKDRVKLIGTGITGIARRTVGTRVFSPRIENLTIEMSGGIGIDASEISTGKFSNLIIRGCSIGVRLGIVNSTFYNNFHDCHITTNDIGVQIDGLANENRFFGCNILNSITKSLDISGCNNISFIGCDIEGSAGNVVDVYGSAQSINFISCRYESSDAAGKMTFDATTRGCTVLGGRIVPPATIEDLGENYIDIGPDRVKSYTYTGTNKNSRYREDKGAGGREHAVQTVHASYSNSTEKTGHRVICSRFGSKAYEAVYESSTQKKATFRVNVVDGSIVMHDTSGNPWKIQPDGAGGLSVTADSPYILP